MTKDQLINLAKQSGIKIVAWEKLHPVWAAAILALLVGFALGRLHFPF